MPKTLQFDKKFIRNFSIIAHIDHGKSTLADRLIQHCEAIQDREFQNQLLDSMDLERERGITIKSQTVRLLYPASDGNIYQLNLMDTPGHVDFSYEVSRCLSACEGSLVVVDSTQGVEAQTIANVYSALDNDHEMIPVLNKIDLASSRPNEISAEIEDILGLDTSNKILASAKTGQGIKDILESIVKTIPSPEGDIDSALKVLLIDSWYDPYLGIITLVRVIDGILKPGEMIRMMSNNKVFDVNQVGIFNPKKVFISSLSAGEVGFIVANIKNISDCKIGDTITHSRRPCLEALSGFKPVQQVVFCGLYPIDSNDFDALRVALGKLNLNDSSFCYEQESSVALGLGFRCGFLGMLHMEIISERITREFDIEIITTVPSVTYHLTLENNEQIEVSSPSEMPEVTKIASIEEPWIRATILVPEIYLGNVLELCTEKRGVQVDMSFNESRVMIVYELPLNEVVYDFHDRIKSVSSGYASFNWEIFDYRVGNIVKMNILVNGEEVEPLSLLVDRSCAERKGRALCEKLKELIPRQMFKIAIQAAIGGKIIARETISALRKDVTAKCYGGDISRKRKLLDKQKAGKKKMKMIGNIELPKSAFIAALKIDS